MMQLWYQVRLVQVGNNPFEVWGQMGEGWTIEEAIAAANPFPGAEYQLFFRAELRMHHDV